MSSLSLTLCGSVAVTGDGVSSNALSAKSIALLSYLALEPGPHSREKLTALLWGDYPDDKAKASLRQALTHLREAIPDSLRVDRTSIALSPRVECDVLAFQRLAKESPRSAAEVPVSEFLSGLHLRRSPAFDEWVDATRARLLRQFAEVLSGVTREAIATRQWRDAARFADRWVSVSPLSASANGSRIEALFMAGDRDAALHAFNEYRSRLSTEVGESPAPDVVALVERIRSAPAPTARRQATEEWYAASPSFDGSLVGRDAEWEALTRAWRRVGNGQSCVALIEGDVGVGKSRLASDFLRWVSAAGGTVLRSRAFDVRGGAPFAAIIEVLRSAINAPGLAGTDPQWLAEVARVVPELRSRFPALSGAATTSGADSWRLFEGIAQLLAAVAEESPVAILIDDLQWCDADSCALLHSVIRRLETSPIFWCLTFSPGAVERDTAAARLVRALRTFPRASSLALRPLTEDEVWQLVRALGRVSAPTGARRLAARIHEVTTGFPFYVVELLKTLFAQGWLTVDAETGEWIVAQGAGETPAATFAPSVHEAIAERIECLPDELRAGLISLAVSARGCRASVLSHMHGISRLHAAAVGDALVERHLAVEEDGVYRCAHPVIARVVRDALGTSRRREMHRSLALALEAAAPGDAEAADPGEIARHAEQGGERGMAYRYAMAAASACEARFAFEEALTWLDLAAGVAGGPADADTVNRTTARLLERSGGRETPSGEWRAVQAGQLAVADVDLPARV